MTVWAASQSGWLAAMQESLVGPAPATEPRALKVSHGLCHMGLRSRYKRVVLHHSLAIGPTLQPQISATSWPVSTGVISCAGAPQHRANRCGGRKTDKGAPWPTPSRAA